MSLDAATLGPDERANALADELRLHASDDAAALLTGAVTSTAVAALMRVPPGLAQAILASLEPAARDKLLAAAPAEHARQWRLNAQQEEDSIGRLMEPAFGVFPPGKTVGETIEALRALVKTSFITYCYVTDPAGKLLGIVTMRDLLFADRARRLSEVMLGAVFALPASLSLEEAMRRVLQRHYPVYPVTDDEGRLLGLVRGGVMFEARAFDIAAQPGSMVGVEKEERLVTPWWQSLKLRHPWLQLNLLTAFLAAAVVGLFQGTLDQLVILALFLPVLAGQSGNTGCQALAVTLRGMTLGELKPGLQGKLVAKEAGLGLLNGALVGITAGLGMWITASAQHSPHAVILGVVVFLAMIGACIMSGLAGALVPLTLKRFGFDPATASSIFLTTATDVVSMGMLLGLATLMIRV